MKNTMTKKLMILTIGLIFSATAGIALARGHGGHAGHAGGGRTEHNVAHHSAVNHKGHSGNKASNKKQSNLKKSHAQKAKLGDFCATCQQ